MKTFVACCCIFFSFTIQAAQSKVCDLAQTILHKAQDNTCFSRLLSKTKNVEDRKWLLKLSNSWNPPRDIVLQRATGGILLFKNKKLSLQARWIRASPPILYWNDRIYIGSEKSKGSLRAMLTDLLKPSKISNRSFFPQAYADPRSDTTDQDFFTLFMLADAGQPMDATTFIEHFSHETVDFFPMIPSYNLNHSGSLTSFQCVSSGELRDYSFDLPGTPVRHLELKPHGENQFTLFGLSAGQTYFLDYTSLKQNAERNVHENNEDDTIKKPVTGLDLCDSPATIWAQADDVCAAGWNEYHKQNPVHSMLSYINANSCENSWENQNLCKSFWRAKKVSQIDQPAEYTFDATPSLYICGDTSCSDMKKTPELDPANSPSQPTLSRILNDAVLSAKMLGACCRQESCRKVALDKIKTQLIPAPTPINQ